MKEADLRHFSMKKLMCFYHIRALMTVDKYAFPSCEDFKAKVV